MKPLDAYLKILFGLILVSGCTKEPTKLIPDIDLPTRYDPNAATVIDNKLYIIHDNEHLKVFDPSSNSWTSNRSMPTQREIAAAGAINGKLYVAGALTGEHYSGFLLEYDPSLDTWVDKAPIPTARKWAAGSVINGDFYVVGGFNPELTSSDLSVLKIYNVTTDNWTKKASMPTARCFSTACNINNRMYVIGGGRGTALDNLEIYNPMSDTWISKAPIPSARHHHTAGVINGKLYVACGTQSYTFDPQLGSMPNMVYSVEVYDPAVDIWMPITPIDKGISRAVSGVIDNKMIIFGLEYYYFDDIGLYHTQNTIVILSP